MKKQNKFNEKTKLIEVMSQEYADILKKYRMPCISCPMARMEARQLELGQIAEMYGLDLKNMLKELNESIPSD